MSEFRFEIDKLNDTNYSSWEFKVRALIQRDNLLTMIDDEPPAVKDENWLKNDGKVRSIILFSITDAQIMHCRQASTSYDTWKALRDFHQKSSLFTKVILLKKICKATYVESTPMSEHILKMKDFFQRLQGRPEPIRLGGCKP